MGVLLAFSTMIVTRWGQPWFTLSLGTVVGVMMISYVAVPARLTGVKREQSTREKLSTSAVTGALSATVCTPPPYLLGRGTVRDPDAPDQASCSYRDPAARARPDASSGRGCGQSNQDERDAHEPPASGVLAIQRQVIQEIVPGEAGV